MKKGMKKTLLTLLTATIITGAALVPSTYKLAPYIKSDIKSELSRKPSAGKPTGGAKGLVLRLGEFAKTGRDIIKFAYQDLFDDKAEYDIHINKDSNTANFYLNDSLVKTITVGTGKVNKPNKEAFGEGEYVTPNGEYIVVRYMSKDLVKRKFGEANAEGFYAGQGMLPLLGPWAPHIAMHATLDTTKIGDYKSNGCINYLISDFDWVTDNVGIGSKVHITGGENNE